MTPPPSPPAPSTATGDSVKESEFAGLMAAFGPFEKAPVVAVAVSGGADSMALALLAQGWAGRRRGRAVALIVDHGLRADSGAEARRAAGWLKSRGLEVHILRWRGEKPSSGIQAAARKARYELLTSWCHQHRVGDLLLGHNLEDQAETVLMRLGRGSGPEGLAAMLPQTPVARRKVRLLRPLLGVFKARLKATLRARGQPWIEDPSNFDPEYERVRVRRVLEQLSGPGFTAAGLAASAERMRAVRQDLDALTDQVVAQSARIFKEGYALIDSGQLMAAPTELGLRALSRVVRCVGGVEYGPRRVRLERLHADLAKAGGTGMKGRTLAGCRLTVAPRAVAARAMASHAIATHDWASAAAGRIILVSREVAACQPPVALLVGQGLIWDRRFQVALPRRRGGAAKAARAHGANLRVGCLGKKGWSMITAADPDLRSSPIPGAVRTTLPALWDRRGVVSVPFLCYFRAGKSLEYKGFCTEFSPQYRLLT